MLYMFRITMLTKEVERLLVFRATVTHVWPDNARERVFRKTKDFVWCNTHGDARRHLDEYEARNTEKTRLAAAKKLEEARELVPKVRGYRDREKNPELRQRFIDELVDLWVRIDNLKKIVG